MGKRRLLVIALLLGAAAIFVFINKHSESKEVFDTIYELRNSGTGDIENQIIQDLKIKRVIGIGESSHGTKEFYDLRIDVVESFLKDSIPINLLIEITIPEGQILDNYITDDTVDFEIFQKIPYHLLKNTSIKSLLELCRHANDKRLPKDKIRIYGIDPSYDKSLIDHLNKIIFNSETGVQIPNELRNYFENLKFENLIDVSRYQRGYIKSRLFDLKKIIPLDANIKYSLAIEQFLQALKRLDEPINSIKSLNIRDSSMARNVEQIVSLDSVHYNILFAHNEHIGINTSWGSVPMGSFLSETYKEEYYPIAVDFIEGSYRVNNTSAILYSRNRDEWLEPILMNEIDVAYIRTDSKYFDRNVKLHAIGARSSSYSFKRHNLRNDYRAIILFRHGTAIDKID